MCLFKLRFSPDICPGVGLLDHMVALVLLHWFIFGFISITLGDRLKKIFLRFMSKSVFPMISSNRFIVSGLTFRSLIHFELFLCMVLENVLISVFYM